jgi:hypothetical protein
MRGAVWAAGGYVIDRERALFGREIVAILASRGRRVRSTVLLRDGSLYRTLTQPATFRRASAGSGLPLPGLAGGDSSEREHGEG